MCACVCVCVHVCVHVCVCVCHEASSRCPLAQGTAAPSAALHACTHLRQLHAGPALTLPQQEHGPPTRQGRGVAARVSQQEGGVRRHNAARPQAAAWLVALHRATRRGAARVTDARAACKVERGAAGRQACACKAAVSKRARACWYVCMRVSKAQRLCSPYQRRTDVPEHVFMRARVYRHQYTCSGRRQTACACLPAYLPVCLLGPPI